MASITIEAAQPLQSFAATYRRIVRLLERSRNGRAVGVGSTAADPHA